MEQAQKLKALWEKAFPDAAVSDACFNEVIQRYREPHRKYHTVEHLAELAAYLEKFESGLTERDFKVVGASLFYHDAVYNIFPDSSGQSNEQLSADMAAQHLGAMGFDNDFVSRVTKIILATQTHQLVPEEDYAGALFLDMDMAILGAAPEKYAQYCSAVREEYGAIPDDVFYPARLHRFLLPTIDTPIFMTGEFVQNFREQAVENMRDEIVRIQDRLRVSSFPIFGL